MAAYGAGGVAGFGRVAVLGGIEEFGAPQGAGGLARVEPGMEVLDTVAGGDQVDSFGAGRVPHCGVEPGEQRAEGGRFGACHLGEVGEVPS